MAAQHVRVQIWQLTAAGSDMAAHRGLVRYGSSSRPGQIWQLTTAGSEPRGSVGRHDIIEW